MCGLPGSGKTTLARRLERELDALRVNSDDWIEALGRDLWDEEFRARIEALQRDIALQVLHVGGDVVIEWGTWTRIERDGLREAARAAGATAELIYLDVPLDELHRRIAARGREDPAITPEHLVEWSALFEAPTVDELATWDRPVRGR